MLEVEARVFGLLNGRKKRLATQMPYRTYRGDLTVHTRNVEPMRSSSVLACIAVRNVPTCLHIALALGSDLAQERDCIAVENNNLLHPLGDVCSVPKDDAVFVD